MKKTKKNSGKILTLILVLIAVVLLSVTAISVFFFVKEIDFKKKSEEKLVLLIAKQEKLVKELEDTKKRSFLLEEKNKEADEKINSLMDDLELEEGLREELKKENQSLKESMAAVEKEVTSESVSSAQAQEEIDGQVMTLLDELDEEKNNSTILAEENKKISDRVTHLENQIRAFEKEFALESVEDIISTPDEILDDDFEAELSSRMVFPTEGTEGRVLSIDKDAEFIIFNLGSKDGIDIGDFLSIVRGADYLGDVKVTRVQEEMSAADFIPPFSSRRVRKNDLVVKKKYQ